MIGVVARDKRCTNDNQIRDCHGPPRSEMTQIAPALPTNQIQSNKLPNKSIKCAKILFQNQTNEKYRI
jgi:hypothetical protein